MYDVFESSKDELKITCNIVTNCGSMGTIYDVFIFLTILDLLPTEYIQNSYLGKSNFISNDTNNMIGKFKNIII